MTLSKIISLVETLPTIYACKTKEELCKQVLDVNKSLANFYKNIPDEYFSSDAIPEGWSVRRNMKHVISTNITFAFWLGLPPFILKLRGKPKKNQPTVEQIDPTNRHGITYYGKYEKSKSFNPKQKEKLLALIESSAEKVVKQIQKRTEEELDTYAGLFGGGNLRTFCYFLLKHNVHHSNVVRQRLES